MRRVTQRIEHGDFNALDLSQRGGGDFLQSVKYASRFLPFLHEEIAVGVDRAMRQGQGNDFKSPKVNVPSMTWGSAENSLSESPAPSNA